MCLVPRVVSKENRFSCNLMQITTNCTFQHSGGQETPCVLSFFQFSIFNLRADINRHRKERSGSIRGATISEMRADNCDRLLLSDTVVRKVL